MALSHEEKLSHLLDLMNLAKADEQISKIETIYILKVAERLGIDQLELARLEALGIEKRSIPKAEHHIIPLFHRSLILMGIDTRINDEEIGFCKNLGLQMGLNLYAINDIIQLALNGYEFMDPQQINDIFKKYYN
ncbi:hypothetical protein C900_01605 [Fulvivirga imtechensis AK7]|uniref:Co-chaperone DjlA N-terminal domain-containing protein n=1 Tax=Fulvivirga imtechensis AK7 TaxID=1237149 RepID=L8JVV7_9BACT|nr:hypothetical protein [Fulvivirga imtechensis]ELR72323.1 hypothetical protein C900_01605 [Fulvivirga imtechensis AK7]